VWLFDFINNCYFWFQNYFRVTESEVPGSLKKIRIEEPSILVISKTLKNQWYS
jgi:hypothetical protein